MKKLIACLGVVILIALVLGSLWFGIDQRQKVLAAAEKQGEENQLNQRLEGRIQELMRELAEARRQRDEHNPKDQPTEGGEAREPASLKNTEIYQMERELLHLLVGEREQLDAALASRDERISELEEEQVILSKDNQRLMESLTKHQTDLDEVNAEAFDLYRQLQLARSHPLGEEDFSRLDPPEQTAERLEQVFIPVLKFKKAKASDVFTFISNVSEEKHGTPLSFLLDLPEEEPEVTVSLQRVNSRDALDFVCHVSELTYSLTEKGEIYIEKDNRLKPEFKGDPFSDPEFEIPGEFFDDGPSFFDE